MEKRMIRIGVDVGGTNTDICAVDEKTGELMVYKLPSSLHDQSAAVVEGVQVIAKEYCQDEGAREMASYVESLIRKVIVRWKRGLAEKPFVIDSVFVRENITKMSIKGKDKNSRKIGFGA